MSRQEILSINWVIELLDELISQYELEKTKAKGAALLPEELDARLESCRNARAELEKAVMGYKS